MNYHPPEHPEIQLATLNRLCLHHDHLKALMQEYALMRREQTYARMADPNFTTNPVSMQQVENQAHLRTSLVIDLAQPKIQPLLDRAATVYSRFAQLVQHYYPDCTVDNYTASAHITVKTITGDVAQNEQVLHAYLPIVCAILDRWLPAMSGETILYAAGLFSSLNRNRGLSLGLRFFPSLPLLQLIRGAVGVALYTQAEALPLRPEAAFHTTLIHSTGFRARLTDFPLHPDFIDAFQTQLEQYDTHLFGTLTDLEAADFVIRHGYSDRLVPLADVRCAP